ncbi:acetamidase/formamidase family protein [Anaerococcus kampingiae]|uniref:Acetamidase/formamidase family protein n=1 Tax=Anaerococcus kampingae TaxID=3115614 RepID=A0ABW9MAW9_9FIRM
MIKIDTNMVIYAMDKDNKEAARAKSGDRIRFETLDCFSCEVTSEDQELSGVDFDKVNPATGPLFVEGAMPGDVLKVTIEKIEVVDQGLSMVEKGLGRLGDKIDMPKARMVDVKGDRAYFRGLEFPLNKMVGVIGTAPAGEAIPTGAPHDHGGNMDCTQVKEGAILYLPVNVEGALLALGDLHAAMGDGEVGGCALEINGAVELKVEVVKDFAYKTPMIDVDNKYITIGSRKSIDEASDLALANMADLIMKKTDLDFYDTNMLMTMAVDLISCQVVNPNMTMRAEISKDIFK